MNVPTRSILFMNFLKRRIIISVAKIAFGLGVDITYLREIIH